MTCAQFSCLICEVLAPGQLLPSSKKVVVDPVPKHVQQYLQSGGRSSPLSYYIRLIYFLYFLKNVTSVMLPSFLKGGCSQQDMVCSNYFVCATWCTWVLSIIATIDTWHVLICVVCSNKQVCKKGLGDPPPLSSHLVQSSTSQLTLGVVLLCSTILYKNNKTRKKKNST